MNNIYWMDNIYLRMNSIHSGMNNIYSWVDNIYSIMKFANVSVQAVCMRSYENRYKTLLECNGSISLTPVSINELLFHWTMDILVKRFSWAILLLRLRLMLGRSMDTSLVPSERNLITVLNAQILTLLVKIFRFKNMDFLL